MISWVDCIGPYGMAGAIKVLDPFQWAVQTPREKAEVTPRRCLDCDSDLHGTDHPSCPAQHDCED